MSCDSDSSQGLGPSTAATSLLEASEECQFPVTTVRDVLLALRGLD